MGSQIFRFCIVGFGNTAIGLSLLYIGMSVLGLGVVGANLLAYGLAMVFGYTINRRWTFRHDGPILKSGPRYMAVLLLAYGCNLSMVVTAHYGLGLPPYPAQFTGMATFTLINFFGSRYFAFAVA